MFLKVLAIILLPSLVFTQTLVLLGDNVTRNNTPIWNAIIQAAGGVGVARIGVVALPQNSEEANAMVDHFNQLCGMNSAVKIDLMTRSKNLKQMTQLISSQTGIFIVDSVRHRQQLIDTLRPFAIDSALLMAIKKVLNRGGMVAGTSNIMGNSAVILEGDAMGALTFGTRFRASPRVPPSYSLKGGLGLLNGYVLDSETSDKGREMRLVRALLDTNRQPKIGTFKGLGIDGNTAFVVTNPLGNHPVGKVITNVAAVTGVFYVDVTNVSISSYSKGRYTNVPFSFLTVNDTMDLTTNSVTYAAFKTAIAGSEWFEKAKPSSDILSLSNSNEWRQAARYLIDCQEVTVKSISPATAKLPLVTVVFDRSRAVGFGADLPNDPNYTYVASYTNMLATITVQ